MAFENPDDLIGTIEKALGLPPGLFNRLQLEGDDWTFVIKSHAMIEAAVTHLLVATIGQTDLHALFARLELSNSATGKIAFVKQLDLLDHPHRRFIRGLSELRNDLVHEIGNVSFSFAAHMEGMTSSEKKAFVDPFRAIFEKSRERFSELTHDEPRKMIWCSMLIVLGLCYTRKMQAELQREKDALDKEIAQYDAQTGRDARLLLDQLLGPRLTPPVERADPD